VLGEGDVYGVRKVNLREVRKNAKKNECGKDKIKRKYTFGAV
jgi:hypothetical protein